MGIVTAFTVKTATHRLDDFCFLLLVLFCWLYSDGSNFLFFSLRNLKLTSLMLKQAKNKLFRSYSSSDSNLQN